MNTWLVAIMATIKAGSTDVSNRTCVRNAQDILKIIEEGKS